MEKKSLISISNEVSRLESFLIETDGELTPEIESQLAVKDLALPEKVDHYHSITEKFELAETYYKQKAEFYQNLASGCGDVVDRLNKNIEQAMKILDTDELKGFDIKFKLVASQASVVIDDESKIPIEYKKEKVTYQVDKKLLKEDLDRGDIPGAHLETKKHLRSYPNRKG